MNLVDILSSPAANLKSLEATWNKVIESDGGLASRVKPERMSMALKPKRNGCTEPQATESSNGEERAASAGGNSALDGEIRRRAYQLYLERGEEHGRDLDDWLQAKREFENRALWPEQAN